MQSLKDKIIAFHKKLNNKKIYNLNIKSLGFTTYVFHLNKPQIKMKTLSFETQDYKVLNNNFIKENNSILAIEDFTIGTFLNNKSFELNTPPEDLNKRNNHYFDEEPAFNFNYINLISNRETYIENFQKWVRYLIDKTKRNLYCLKYTKHFSLSMTPNDNEDGYKLGIAVFLISDGRSGKEKLLSNIKNELEVFFDKNKFEFFKYGFVEYANEIEYKNIEIINNSLKAALAAVMARNMSHNIGSHVLSRFSHEEDIDDIVRDFNKAQFIVNAREKWEENYNNEITNTKEKIIGNSSDFTDSQFYKKWKKKGIILNNGNANYIDLLATHELKNKRTVIFNNYIKERQELLAEITSTVPVIQTTKKLKGDIIDRFTDNRILLDRISGVDDFKFTFKFDINIDDKDQEDVSVAVANDVLGQQALYIIFENIIRNTAKHGSKITKKVDWFKAVVFTIRVRESTLNPNYYQITIFDNLTVDPADLVELKDINQDFYNAYYKDVAAKYCSTCNEGLEEEHTCSINRLTKLIVDQNELINRDILNSNNELRTEALGLIEMEACAAYLRNMPIEKIADDDYEIKFSTNDRERLKEEIKKGTKDLRILRTVNPLKKEALQGLNNNEIVDKSDFNNRENVLGYRFYLPKPQELLILDRDNQLQYNDDQKKSALKQGILVLNNKVPDSFFEFDENKIYPHEQMLVIGSFPANIKKEFLPKRFLIVDNSFEEYKEKLTENNFDNLKEKVLKEIVKNKMETKKISIESFKEGEKNSYADILYVNGGGFKEIKFKFDDHGTEYKGFKNGTYFQILTHREKMFAQHNLIPFATGLLSLGTLRNKMAVLKMFDSCLNNILVLDERIQEKANSYYALEGERKITYREVWQNVGCFIPWQEEINLLRTDFKIKDDKSIPAVEHQIKEWIKSFSNGKLKTKKSENFEDVNDIVYSSIDTLIIHVGVIEKCIEAREKNENKESPNVKKEFVESLFEGTGVNIDDVNIILTSGRAPKKENLVPEFSFLTLSVLSDYLINNRFKYSLNELCNVARPKI